MSHRVQTPVPWPSADRGVDDQIAAVLSAAGARLDVVDELTVRTLATPAGPGFSKQRTNLLFRRIAGDGAIAYVDADFNYIGDDPRLKSMFGLPGEQNWKRIGIEPVAGSLAETLAAVLDLIGSSLAPQVRKLARKEQEGRWRVLAALGESVVPSQAAAAFGASFRKQLATELAAATTRVRPPRSIFLWGESGVGTSELMLATVHPLYEMGRIDDAIRIAAARLAAGCVLPPERDAALANLLGELHDRDRLLLLVDDLDVLVSGSPVSIALLTRAFDRGLRMIATIRQPAFLAELARDEPGIERRVVATYVPPANDEETRLALARLAEECGVTAAPEAVSAAIALANQQDAVQPAGALANLAAAIAAAQCSGRSDVDPLDVVSALKSVWPSE